MNRAQLIWKNLVLLVRRAPKDRRARWALLWILLASIGVLAYAALVLLNPGTYIMVPPALLVLWLIRRSHKQADAGFIKLSGVAVRSETEELAEHRKELANVALVLAAMIDRAGSEAFLKTKEMPEGTEVITRQRLVAMLRSTGRWEAMSSMDREMMMLPDKMWDWQQISDVLRQVEDLRVLRWVLRIDTYLLPIEQAYRLHLDAATGLSGDPMRLQGDGCLQPWEMTEAREYANSYFGRCWAEEQKRGLRIPPEEKTSQTMDALKETPSDLDEEDTSLSHEAIVQYAMKLGSQQSGDFLLGFGIVGDASDEQLKDATMVAWRRTMSLDRLMHYLRGPSCEVGRIVMNVS
jgi:hypothetical protein